MKLTKKLETLLKVIEENGIKIAIKILYEEFLKNIYKILPHNGVRVVNENWDYLIVLSSCRYDYFKKLYRNYIKEGILKKKVSLGSCTREWFAKNFENNYYNEIVYVSANPRAFTEFNTEFGRIKGTENFYRVFYLGELKWNKELNTVPPEEVTKAALRVKKKYPNKKMIIHYLQPHAPWIGKNKISGKELGISFSNATEWFKNSGKIGPYGMFGRAVELVGLNYLRKAYEDNLRLVLKEVEKLVNELDGKIIITADHGEAFGEKFIIEHPGGIYIKELVEVPWLVINKPKNIRETERMNIKYLKTKKRL